jgi:2-keto-4-pentenoate hydratase/2-oxohepta-3-ene-1,7-dioic acid hydratase in catechol pathway
MEDAEYMKLVTYLVESEGRHGAESGVRHGLLRGEADTERIVDLGAGDLLALIEAGPAGLERAQAAAGAERDLNGVRLLAPVLRPPKLLALARNYQDHITEGGGQPVDKRRIVPKLFLKPSSAIIGPDAAVYLPTVSHTTDWEVELAVVIGTRCRNVPLERALDMVFGYTIANDISARTTDWGVERDPDQWNEFFDWLNGKWPDGFAPLGPYILTADERPDPQGLALELYLNGERKQHSTTREMISTVAETIAFASRFMTLEPGDIIETGTPSGVGATTGTYVKAGDVMEARIDKLGTLRTPVLAALATPEAGAARSELRGEPGQATS